MIKNDNMNYFILGYRGYGKTWILKEYCKQNPDKKKVLVTNYKNWFTEWKHMNIEIPKISLIIQDYRTFETDGDIVIFDEFYRYYKNNIQILTTFYEYNRNAQYIATSSEINLNSWEFNNVFNKLLYLSVPHGVKKHCLNCQRCPDITMSEFNNSNYDAGIPYEKIKSCLPEKFKHYGPGSPYGETNIFIDFKENKCWGDGSCYNIEDCENFVLRKKY